jgi:hypothetical protein
LAVIHGGGTPAFQSFRSAEMRRTPLGDEVPVELLDRDAVGGVDIVR